MSANVYTLVCAECECHRDTALEMLEHLKYCHEWAHNAAYIQVRRDLMMQKKLRRQQEEAQAKNLKEEKNAGEGDPRKNAAA